MKYFNETYTKRKFITRNEWADTYKAIHATTEEKVILKVLVNKSNDEEYINQLLKEVESLKSIDTSNLIQVNNMFQYSGGGKTYYYIEGEYFKGISLEEKLASEKFEEKEAVRLVKAIAEGIKELHNRNILFYNLSLSNILINSKNVVKADILSYLENKDFVTSSQNESEEKIDPYQFNPEENINDLGVILYSLLTGKYNFESSNYKKQISDENLVSIIEKCTNNNLESKYRNINRFILDLKSYLQYGELSNESYDVVEITTSKKKRKKESKKESKKERKKGKVGKTLGVCASIVLVGGVAVYGYDLLEKNKSNVETTKIEESTKTKEENKKIEENEKDKTEEDKTTTSNKTDNQSSEKESSTTDSKKSSTSNSDKSNDSSTSSGNNSTDNDNKNSNNNSGNNTSKPNKPSKPSNNEGSDDTTTKPDEGNDTEEQPPEVKPPSDGSTDDNENTQPQSPVTQGEGE